MVENYYTMSILRLLNMSCDIPSPSTRYSTADTITQKELKAAIIYIINVPPLDELLLPIQCVAEVFRNGTATKEEAIAYILSTSREDIERWIQTNRELNVEGSFANA
jgi:hypothetical protein